MFFRDCRSSPGGVHREHLDMAMEIFTACPDPPCGPMFRAQVGPPNPPKQRYRVPGPHNRRNRRLEKPGRGVGPTHAGMPQDRIHAPSMAGHSVPQVNLRLTPKVAQHTIHTMEAAF